MKQFTFLKPLLMAIMLVGGVSYSWAGAPVSGSDYLIKNVQTGYYLVGGIDWGTHACLHKMPQWFTFTGSDNVYTLDSHQFNNNADYHFLATGLYVDGATTNWTVTETATPGVFTISNDGNYIAGNGVDAAITTTTDGTAAEAQWQLISYSDFVSTLEGEIGVSGVDATPYIKDPELKRNGNFITYSGTKPWSITGYDGTGTPKYSEGYNGNNASCAESFQSSNGFKFAQTLTGMKPGQYKLTAQAFYRQDGTDTDNYPYLFVGDAKSYFPERSGTENDMVAAYASFLSGTYPVAPITFVVSSESDNVTIGYANANVKMWNIFGQTQLTYYGTALINDAIPFNNGGEMTAGQWYYFDATVAGTYEFSAGSDLTAISYTTDGTQVTSSATGTTLTASPTLSVTRYYFKSSSAQTLTVDVPTGAQIVNADIDFSSATTSNETVLEGSVFNGTLNSIVIGQGQFRESQAGWLSLDDGTSTITIPSAQRAGSRDIVNVQFKRAWGNKNGMGSGISLKDTDGAAVFNFTYARWGDGDTNNANIDMAGLLGAQTSNAPVKDRYTLFDITINYATRTITSYVECVNTDGKGTHKSETFNAPLTNTNPIATFNAWGYNVGGNKDRADIINDIKITTTKGDYSVSEVGYTVKFVDGNGTKVKDDVTDRESVAGTAISTLATSDDQTTFYNDGDITNNNTVEFVGATNKYVYRSISAVNSSEEAITELEAGAIVTVVYDKYNKYDYAVKQKLGAAAATDKETGTLWGDQTYSYYFPVGVEESGDYYFTEANGSSPYFRGTLTSAAPTETINYTLDPTVVFYSEGEDIESKTDTYTHYPNLMANGSCGVLNDVDGNLITNLPAGIYTITARTVGRGDGGRTIYFYKSSVDAENIVLTATPNYTSGSTETSAAFALTDATNILVKGAAGGGANGNGLDYVIIRKLPDTVSGTIGSTGWTTFASAYPLNLSSITASTGTVTAYYASSIVGDSYVRMTSTTSTVAAGEGLMLKGTVGATITIPVAASGEAISGNLLKGCTTETVLSTSESKYVLVKNGGTAEFQSLAEHGATIPAGKAYLDASIAGVKALRIVFEDNETGVESIEHSPLTIDHEAGAMFDLSGRRVSKAQKGIFIANGKKVVVK